MKNDYSALILLVLPVSWIGWHIYMGYQVGWIK